MQARSEILGTLEIGRFLAASVVVLTHFFGDLPHYGTGSTAGFLGAINLPAPLAVQYFFVLSGFVMMTAHRRDFGQLGALPRFWWRRACRIYPMYWLALASTAVFLYAALTPKTALLLVSLAPREMTEFVAQAWTLRFEMAFYIGFGLCLLPYVGRWILAVWVFGVFWCWRPAALHSFLLCAPTKALLWFSGHVAPLFFAPFDLFFFAGLAAGAIRLANARAGIAAIVLGVLVLALVGPDFAWGYSYGGPLTPAAIGAGLGLLMLGCAALERSGVLRIGAWARRLGAVSYPLYILHAQIMLLVGKLLWGRLHLHGAGMAGFAVVYLLFVFGTATAAAFWLDRPLQRVLRRLPARFASAR
jgi:peptidoglycan/LPS O-acetylase OafA/YrhL